MLLQQQTAVTSSIVRVWVCPSRLQEFIFYLIFVHTMHTPVYANELDPICNVDDDDVDADDGVPQGDGDDDDDVTHTRVRAHECGVNLFYLVFKLPSPQPPSHANTRTGPGVVYTERRYLQQCREEIDEGGERLTGCSCFFGAMIENSDASEYVIYDRVSVCTSSLTHFIAREGPAVPFPRRTFGF